MAYAFIVCCLVMDVFTSAYIYCNSYPACEIGKGKSYSVPQSNCDPQPLGAL